jgi:hypothetical protein
MTQEIPPDVIEAIKLIATWARGEDDLVDDILERAAPVLDNWLVERGLLPAYDDGELL